MKQYGERRHQGWSTRRYWHERGNRGRNRALATRNRWTKHTAPSGTQKIIDRHCRKAARRQGREEIVDELHLMWLEQELGRVLSRPFSCRARHQGHLQPVLTTDFLDALLDAQKEAMDMQDLIRDLQEDDDAEWIRGSWLDDDAGDDDFFADEDLAHGSRFYDQEHGFTRDTCWDDPASPPGVMHGSAAR